MGRFSLKKAIAPIKKAVERPIQQLITSTVKVATNPKKANFGDFVSAINPLGATLVNDYKNPSDALVHGGAALGISALIAPGAGAGAAAWQGPVKVGATKTGFFSGFKLPAMGALKNVAPWAAQLAKKGGAGFKEASSQLQGLTGQVPVEQLQEAAQQLRGLAVDEAVARGERPDTVPSAPLFGGAEASAPLFVGAGGSRFNWLLVVVPGGLAVLAFLLWRSRKR